MVTIDQIRQTATSAGLPVAETYVVPPREARYAPIPDGLHPKVAAALREGYQGGLFAHQAKAIALATQGADVCLATPTASGKSLAFMATAAQTCCKDRFAKVLAVYPAKALIQDQLQRWESFVQPFGLRVGYVDGSVPTGARAKTLADCGIVLMTPDVLHAWVMSHTTEKEVAHFLTKLKFVVLDEAHVYDGVIGTNMAYLLRRLSMANATFRLMTSTATIGQPETFIEALTGRRPVVLTAGDDGSGSAEKAILLCPVGGLGSFDVTVRLLSQLVKERRRFIAFGDSRKSVERIVAATLRHGREDDDDEESEEEDAPFPASVLPYRAGYEAEDRERIQTALTNGTLGGVVSTSALELGLDIGDLDVAVLMNTPPSVNAFWQRVGRAGRKSAGACIVLDDQQRLSPLSKYVVRPPEPGWLYLDNKYIQYANALCAAVELQARGVRSVSELNLASLPPAFVSLLENELNQTSGVPQDLYTLKQKAQASPHYEFPLRSATEQSFKIQGPFDRPLGEVSYSQMLREAYPGAVHYYLARPYRIIQVDHRNQLIRARREKYLTTRPDLQTMAFPRFDGGLLQAFRSGSEFLVEAEMQVSERVTGFLEIAGKNKTPHVYGPLSSYSQRPMNRFFQTTGVCWSFDDVALPDDVVKQIARAFCFLSGIHDRDIGVGHFHANMGPFAPGPARGIAIYDATNGSLRLTQKLPDALPQAIEHVMESATGQTQDMLEQLLEHVRALQPEPLGTVDVLPTVSGSEWTQIIAEGQPAIYRTADGPLEVTVVGWRYTPQGLLYELQHDKPGKWQVVASGLLPIHGRTEFKYVNFTTGDERTDAPATV